MVILQKKIAGASEQSLARFLRQARRAAGVRGRVNLLVTGSRELRDLNRRFRGQNGATDVLSFPALPTQKDFNGEIAISADIAAENARRLGHRAADELKILTLHGVLHLAGYDHESDQGRMARKEVRLRRELGLPNSLISRANSHRGDTATPHRARANSAVQRRRAAESARRPR